MFAYREQHLVFAEHFIRENGYYSTTHDITWLDDTLSSGRRIKMLNYEGVVSTFLLRATPLPEDLSRFIVKCTEITELDEIYQEQERLAMIDSLTEIYNRLKFQQILEVEWEKVIRSDEKIAIILFDIDNFKTVNDTYGHDFGDLALIQLAELMKSKVETTCICKMGRRRIHYISDKYSRKHFKLRSHYDSLLKQSNLLEFRS